MSAFLLKLRLLLVIEEPVTNRKKKMKNNNSDKELRVLVNGKLVTTNPFVETIFTNTIESMISSLKLEDTEIHSIKIEIDKKGKS